MLALLPALFSCQSEAPQESKVDTNEFRIKAYIDTPEDTRAAIEYAYQDSTKEIFTWLGAYNKDSLNYGEDYITLFNISKFSEFHQSKKAPFMYLDNIIGKQAEFVFAPEDAEESTNIALFQNLIEPGDSILAVVCEAHAAKLADCDSTYSNVFSYQASSHLYDQKIVENPTTATALKHVHMMMRMYDVVKVDENKEIPDLHFKHFSSIFRVTLQNQTGKPLFNQISEIVFTASSGERRTFIYGFNYFSVVGDENGGFHLEENFKETEKRHPLNPTKPDTTVVVTHKAVHQINKINGKTLNNGEKYEFYSVVTPRIGGPKYSPEVVDSLTIDVYNGGAESGYYEGYNVERYTITIDNFNRKIEPGKRYWFKLTATDVKEKFKVDIYDTNDPNKVTGTTEMDAYKLVFTSQYKDPEENKDNNGEDTSTNQ